MAEARYWRLRSGTRNKLVQTLFIRNDEHELAIGNVIGSCFFNVVAVPAAMALVGSAGLAVSTAALTFDIPVMLLAVVACLPIFFSGHRISRYEGAIFLVYYFTYSMLLYTRGVSDSLMNGTHTEIEVLSLAVLAITVVVIALRTVRYHRHFRKERNL